MSHWPEHSSGSFPLQGIIGVVSVGAAELALANDHDLQCVEIRADLLLASGHSVDDLLALLKKSLQQGLQNLFTLRHASQGGKFAGDEQQRAEICRAAFKAGAALADLEWGTSAADTLLSEGFPLVLSYHNFTQMLSDTELHSLTEKMSAGRPAAIKVVPTVSSLADAGTMLQWVAATEPGIRRIGFGMGEAGAISRIMTLAYGAPLTYTAFGEPVAPGQIALDKLQTNYRCTSLDQHSKVLGLIDAGSDTAALLQDINQQLAAAGKNAICIQINEQELAGLGDCADLLRLRGVKIEAVNDAQALQKWLPGNNFTSPLLIDFSAEEPQSLPFSAQAMLALFD